MAAVHVGPGGVFIDSKVYGNKKKDEAGAPQTFISTSSPVRENDPNGNQGVNLATRRRPSDDGSARELPRRRSQ